MEAVNSSAAVSAKLFGGSIKPMVIGFPMLPRGGRVGVAVGRGVGDGAGVGVSWGVSVNVGVGVGVGVGGVQADINTRIVMATK
jgi:hypothetical protein